MVIDVKNVTVQYTISNFREIGLKAVSYTHLTLPTNSRV